jgi:amphi-Trp domain-containing protein
MPKPKPKAQDTFTHESLQDCESVVEYLRAVETGLCQRALHFSSGGQQLVFRPQPMVKFALKAERKGSRARLVIKLSWKEPEERDEPGDPLVINPGKPRA